MHGPKVDDIHIKIHVEILLLISHSVFDIHIKIQLKTSRRKFTFIMKCSLTKIILYLKELELKTSWLRTNDKAGGFKGNFLTRRLYVPKIFAYPIFILFYYYNYVMCIATFNYLRLLYLNWIIGNWDVNRQLRTQNYRSPHHLKRIELKFFS